MSSYQDLYEDEYLSDSGSDETNSATAVVVSCTVPTPTIMGGTFVQPPVVFINPPVGNGASSSEQRIAPPVIPSQPYLVVVAVHGTYTTQETA